MADFGHDRIRTLPNRSGGRQSPRCPACRGRAALAPVHAGTVRRRRLRAHPKLGPVSVARLAKARFAPPWRVWSGPGRRLFRGVRGTGASAARVARLAEHLEELAHRDVEGLGHVEDAVQPGRERARLHPADALAVHPAALRECFLAEAGGQPVLPYDVTEELAPLTYVIGAIGRGHRCRLAAPAWEVRTRFGTSGLVDPACQRRASGRVGETHDGSPAFVDAHTAPAGGPSHRISRVGAAVSVYAGSDGSRQNPHTFSRPRTLDPVVDRSACR